MVEDIMKSKNILGDIKDPQAIALPNVQVAETSCTKLTEIKNEPTTSKVITNNSDIIPVDNISVTGALKPEKEDEEMNEMDQVVDRTGIAEFHVNKQKQANNKKETRVFENKPPVFARLPVVQK